MRKKTSGTIYILTNPSFPEWVKVGFTTNLPQRLKTLNNSTMVPFSFRLFATYDVPCAVADKKFHDLLGEFERSQEEINGKTRRREFFKASPEAIFQKLQSFAEIHGTEKRLHRYNERKPSKQARIDLFSIGLKPGDLLNYIPDKRIKVKVVDNRHIEYKGEITSLTAVAKQLLNRSRGVRGPQYWMFNGTPLLEMEKKS